MELPWSLLEAWRTSMVTSRQPKVSRLTQLGHARPLLAALHPRKIRRPVFGNINVVPRGDAALHRHTRIPGACASTAAVTTKPSREPRRAQPAASLIAVSKLFGSKAGMLWIRPRCWVAYQTENAS